MEWVEWIPCSERLPNEWEHVLVTTDCSYKSPIEIDWCVNEKWAFNRDSVYAWMPLPEPYKPQTEQKGDGDGV